MLHPSRAVRKSLTLLPCCCATPGDAVQLGALTAQQLQGMTPTQISAFKPAQLAALTSFQVPGISLKCLRLFTEEQRTAFSTENWKLIGSLPQPGGWLLDLPWRQRFEWAPRVEKERLPPGAEAGPAKVVDPRDGIAEEVEESEDLLLVLVEEAGEDRFWKAADVAAAIVMDEDEWLDEGRYCAAGHTSSPFPVRHFAT